MKLLVSLTLCLSVGLQAQVVDGMMKPESQQITMLLYGKRTPVQTWTAYLCNYTANAVTINPEQIYIAVPSVQSINATDATAVLTEKYGNKPLQKFLQFVTIITGGIGFAQGGGAFTLSARALAYMLGGSTLLNQYIVPTLTQNQPTLATLLQNSLDGSGQIILAQAGCTTRKVFAAMPAKGTVQTAVHFQFVPGQLNIPVPVPSLMGVRPTPTVTELMSPDFKTNPDVQRIKDVLASEKLDKTTARLYAILYGENGGQYGK